MSTPPLSPHDVSILIDHLLKAKDPATVGLRRILRRKADESTGFPLKHLDLEEFKKGEGGQNAVFDSEEVRILELEKQLTGLRAQVESEREKGRKLAQAAYARGIAHGREEGRQEGAREAENEYAGRLEQVEARIASMLSDVLDSRKKLLHESHRQVVELAMIVAHKVISTEIGTNPGVVLAVVKKALSFMGEKEKLTVRVSDEDLETLTKKKEFWLTVAERLESIDVQPDPRIGRGGCIIESGSGVADARIDVLLKEVRDVVDATWENVTSRQEEAPADEGHEARADSGMDTPLKERTGNNDVAGPAILPG